MSPKPFDKDFKIDDIVAEPLGYGNDDLGGRRRLVGLFPDELVIGLDAGFRFGLPGLGGGGDPLALGLQRALARFLLSSLLQQPLLLLLQPGRIIALVGNAAAAIEFENPARHIVEEIAIVGDDQDGAGVLAQVPFEPVHRLGVEMVGRLVEQQHFRFFEQQPAQCDAAALAARQRVDVGLVAGTAERLHRLFDLAVEVPQPLRLDFVLQTGHFVGGLVGIVHREFIVAVEDRLFGRNPEHDIAAHAEVGIEMRLLRQIADARALGDEAFSDEFRVDAGHDAQQRRFARAVDPEHADLGVGVEGKVDVLQHFLAARPGLGEGLHVINELPRHALRHPFKGGSGLRGW